MSTHAQKLASATIFAIGMSLLGTWMYEDYQHEEKLHATYLSDPTRYAIKVNYGRGVGWKEAECEAQDWHSSLPHKLQDKQTGKYIY